MLLSPFLSILAWTASLLVIWSAYDPGCFLSDFAPVHLEDPDKETEAFVQEHMHSLQRMLVELAQREEKLVPTTREMQQIMSALFHYTVRFLDGLLSEPQWNINSVYQATFFVLWMLLHPNVFGVACPNHLLGQGAQNTAYTRDGPHSLCHELPTHSDLMTCARLLHHIQRNIPSNKLPKGENSRKECREQESRHVHTMKQTRWCEPSSRPCRCLVPTRLDTVTRLCLASPW